MPGRNDIADPGVERNPVQRRMRLDEAPVLLLGQLVILGTKRHAHVVQPRREVPEWIRQLGRLEDKQRADHLHPGRPGLAPGADNNVARPEAKADPPAAVLAGRLIVDQVGGRGRHGESLTAPSGAHTLRRLPVNQNQKALSPAPPVTSNYVFNLRHAPVFSTGELHETRNPVAIDTYRRNLSLSLRAGGSYLRGALYVALENPFVQSDLATLESIEVHPPASSRERTAAIASVGSAFPDQSYSQDEVGALLGLENKVVKKLLRSPHIQKRHFYFPGKDAQTGSLLQESPADLHAKFRDGALEIGSRAIRDA